MRGWSAGDRRHMSRAVELARENPDAPFGCVIAAPGGEWVSEAYNEPRNPVRHAETAAIYDLAERLAGRGTDADWSELTLYTTAEPCPMCAGAILWSGLGRVVLGSSLETLVRLGLPQINVSLREVAERASGDFVRPEIEAGLLEAECDALYEKLVRDG